VAVFPHRKIYGYNVGSMAAKKPIACRGIARFENSCHTATLQKAATPLQHDRMVVDNKDVVMLLARHTRALSGLFRIGQWGGDANARALVFVAVRRVPPKPATFLHAAYTRPSRQRESHPASVVAYSQNESFSNFVS
jgi:hypothetical protein